MKFQRTTKTYNSSSYIGSGNKSSTFNRKAKSAFQKIRTVYGNQLSRNQGEIDYVTYGNLSEEEKVKIRNHVQSIITKEKKRQFYSYLSYFILIVFVILLTIIIMN